MSSFIPYMTTSDGEIHHYNDMRVMGKTYMSQAFLSIENSSGVNLADALTSVENKISNEISSSFSSNISLSSILSSGLSNEVSRATIADQSISTLLSNEVSIAISRETSVLNRATRYLNIYETTISVTGVSATEPTDITPTNYDVYKLSVTQVSRFAKLNSDFNQIGRKICLVNVSSNAIGIVPPTGSKFQGSNVNASKNIPANGSLHLLCVSDNTWFVI